MDTGFDLKKFGNRIRLMREEQKMTFFDLAIEVGINMEYLEALEHGTRAPTVKLVIILAENLKTSPEFLLGISDSNTSSDVFHVDDAVMSQCPEELERVLNNETGWHARGFLGPNREEKETLKQGLNFRVGPPRELSQFYWEIAPWILTRIRTLNLLKTPDFNPKE